MAAGPIEETAMATTDVELRTMLRTIAERWPVVTAPDILAALPASMSTTFPWSVGELSNVLRHGEPETLLAWVRRQGKQAPHDGLGHERFSAALTGVVAA